MSANNCRKSTRNKRPPLKDKTNDTLKDVRTSKVDFGSLKSNSSKHKYTKTCSQGVKSRLNLNCKSPQSDLQSVKTKLNLRTCLRGRKSNDEPQKCENRRTTDSGQNLSSMQNRPRRTLASKNVTTQKTKNKPPKSSQFNTVGNDKEFVSSRVSVRSRTAANDDIPNGKICVSNNKTKNTKISQKSALKHDTNKALKNNKNPNLQTVHFESDEDSLVKFTKVLRKRNTKNYRDSSLINESIKEQEEKSDKKESEPKRHVPIYLQKDELRPVGNQNDPYEFVLLSPTRKKGKRLLNAEDSSDSDSNVYDKTMHDVLKEVKRKVLTKAKNKQRKNVNKGNNNKNAKNNLPKNAVVNTKSNNILTLVNEFDQNIKSKQQNRIDFSTQNENLRIRSRNRLVESSKINVKNKSGINTNSALNNQHKNVNTNVVVQLNLGNGNKNKQNVAGLTENRSKGRNNVSVKPSKESHQFFGFSDDEEDEEVEGEMSRILPEPSAKSTIITNIKPAGQNPLLKKFISLTSTPLPNMQRAVPSKIQLDSSKQINIISNIVLSPPSNVSVISNSIPTPNKSVIVNRRPTFQRRMIRSPWRGDDLNVTRNPHWLAMKNTSLPSYNQEMIMEPKLLEKTDVAKTPAYTEESRKQDNMVQSSILHFIDSNILHSPARIQNSSLFDESDFSPLKKKISERSPMITRSKGITETPVKAKDESLIRSKKQNRSPTKNSNKTPNKNALECEENVRYKTRSKRNILETIDNKVPSSENKSSPNVENYFGFEDEESEKENVRGLRKRRHVIKKNEDARPMRMELKQLKKIREEVVEELLDNIIVEEPHPLPQSPVKESVTGTQDEVGLVGLFEDFEEVKPAHRSYNNKKRRRVRFPSVNSEPEEEEEEKPKRKRKDLRTLAEEEEFNKWAMQFNAMCDEVEQHTLELE